MFVNRSTVIAAIEATAETGIPVGIQYVKATGKIVEMNIHKPAAQRELDRAEGSETNYRIRERGLIRAMNAQNEPRSFFIFSIIGFRPAGSDQYYTVQHE